MISLRGVSKRFGREPPAVENLSLEIAEGEMLVLVGPSGCGKTTTMKMINRLIEPDSGQILVGGVDVMSQDPVTLRRGIGYVIQSIGLLPHRKVADNIATVPDLLGWDRKKIGARVEELAEMLQLDRPLLGRYPSELSGGQRQRVGVARALAADPPVMLMDEPFGAVDPVVRGRLQDQFLEIQDRLKKTVVFVTHDIDEAIKMADRMAILNSGARVEQVDAPEKILRDPANDFVVEFVGEERGLKRLSLIKVKDVGLDEGPVVSPSTPPSEALLIMEKFNLDWATLVDEGALLGWIDRTEVEQNPSKLPGPRPFSASVTRDSSLREALDSVVTSKTYVAVVVEADRYLGLLNLESIGREIIS